MILLREILFCNAKQVNLAMYRLLFAEVDFSKASIDINLKATGGMLKLGKGIWNLTKEQEVCEGGIIVWLFEER